MVVINGILLGLFLSCLIGTTFFMLIETSINKGFRAALAMNIGVFFSDLSCILIAYFGAKDFISAISQNHYLKLIAGIFFIGFGLGYLSNIIRKDSEKSDFSNDNRGYIALFFKGFFVNMINPSVVTFWFSTLVLAITTYEYKGINVILFFGSALLVILIIDVTKIYFARKLKGFIKPKAMKYLQVIMGILLIAFGISLIKHLF